MTGADVASGAPVGVTGRQFDPGGASPDRHRSLRTFPYDSPLAAQQNKQERGVFEMTF